MERVRRAQVAPPGVQGSGHDRAEQRPEAGAGDEVAPARRTTALRVETVLRVVQRRLDDLVEAARTVDRYGPITLDAASPNSAKTCGYTPTATTTDTVMPIAAISGVGTRTGVRSSSGTGLIHIWRTMLA